MDPTQYLTEADLFAHSVRDMVNAISDRPGESTDQRFVRTEVATHLILGLAPRGTIEVMLAGHAVMFHAVITDSVSNTLHGEIDKTRRGTRANIVAMDRAFHQNLDKLKQYQTRASESASEAEPAPRSQEAVITQVETMGDANDAPMSQPVPAPAIRENQPPVATSTAFMAAAHGGQTIDPAAAIIPFASPPTQEDTQTAEAPPRLNRAQRRQLRHGRMARHG